MELPSLPSVPDDCPITAALVGKLHMLKIDDDFGTLDLYVGAMEVLVVNAILALEVRLNGST
jgi:hypothetical protein